MKRKKTAEDIFGRFAIQNLTMVLIVCYIIGYLIEIFAPNIIDFLSLNPYAIVYHLQLWRLVSWLLIPPGSLGIFTVIMLFFYYSIGTTLERTWGVFRYNTFLWTGMIFTILAAFLWMIIVLVGYGDGSGNIVLEGTVYSAEMYFYYLSAAFSTYYINLSIFLAFAITYPNMQVLLMFVIPVKVKWLGILDVVMLLYEMVVGGIATKFVIAAALLNVLIFYLTTKNLSYLRPDQIRRRTEFKRKVARGETKSPMITRHKCAICGITEKENPNMEFRFCSKCNGNYEYCSEHLFTHEHKLK
ncbi:MAG: hypothetical protein J6033_03135 [Lachnospiraceae bacterium]|nr:hypothetical protein [Lachnospiraceae bacterium]